MATSGSVDFSVSRDDLITEALQICGVLGEGMTPSTSQLSDCSRTLNMLVKSLQNKGISIHAIQHGIVFPAHDTRQYKLGGSGSDHSCNQADFVFTTIRTDYASGTTLEVTSTAGMATSDTIGVILDDGTIEWKTATVDDGDTITLSGGLSGAASAGNYVYTYTTKINRPLRIISAFTRYIPDLTDTELTILSQEEYDALSNKTSEADRVNQIYYDPQLSQGLLSVWPEPNDMRNVIFIRYVRPLEDFDAAGNTADFPQEWYLPLAWGLASLIASKYGVPVNDRTYIKQNYEMMLKDVMDWDIENSTSIFFRMDTSGYE